MARSADVELTIDDFQKVADKTPYLADLKYVSHQALHQFFFTLLTSSPGLRAST